MRHTHIVVCLRATRDIKIIIKSYSFQEKSIRLIGSAIPRAMLVSMGDDVHLAALDPQARLSLSSIKKEYHNNCTLSLLEIGPYHLVKLTS